MRNQRIVAIGASAGGVDALRQIVSGLRGDFPAPIFVVLHIPPDSPSVLPQILDREGRLRAKAAEDGERMQNGVVYVAPPDRHLLVERSGKIRVTRGPRENRHRPAIDPLFRSAALAAGANAIGVVLTGSLDDGTAGLQSIKRRGGIAIVQDPDEALYPSMPQSAIENVRDIDHVASIAEIPLLLERLVRERRTDASISHDDHDQIDLEVRISEMDPEAMEGDERPGTPSAFSCPDCGGVLWEIKEGEYGRFRCRVGHAYSPESMLGAQADKLEEALWSAMKTLEETARLTKRLAESERMRGHTWMAERFEAREKESRERAQLIREAIMRQSSVPAEVPDELSQESGGNGRHH